MTRIERKSEIKRQFSQSALWDVFYEGAEGETYESDFPECTINEAGYGNYTVERGNKLILVFNEKDVASVDIMPGVNEKSLDTVTVFFSDGSMLSAAGF